MYIYIIINGGAITIKDELTEDFLLFNELSNELSGLKIE